MIPFKKWIKMFEHDRNPQGDLARDIRADSNFSEEECNPKRIRQYLVDRGACYHALRVADSMINRYTLFERPSKMERIMANARAEKLTEKYDLDYEQAVKFLQWQDDKKLERQQKSAALLIEREKISEQHRLEKMQTEKRLENMVVVDPAEQRNRIIKNAEVMTLNEKELKKMETE